MRKAPSLLQIKWSAFRVMVLVEMWFIWDEDAIWDNIKAEDQVILSHIPLCPRSQRDNDDECHCPHRHSNHIPPERANKIRNMKSCLFQLFFSFSDRAIWCLSSGIARWWPSSSFKQLLQYEIMVPYGYPTSIFSPARCPNIKTICAMPDPIIISIIRT